MPSSFSGYVEIVTIFFSAGFVLHLVIRYSLSLLGFLSCLIIAGFRCSFDSALTLSLMCYLVFNVLYGERYITVYIHYVLQYAGLLSGYIILSLYLCLYFHY